MTQAMLFAVLRLLPCPGKEYNQAVDLWALGVLYHEFLTGEPPFVADTQDETFALIAEANFSWR